MIVDTSALASIVFDESDAAINARALSGSRVNRISAGTLVECSIVVDSRKSPLLSGRLDELMTLHHIQVEPVSERQAALARQAFRDYGRGSGHPAALNYGDCFAYALAKDLGEPLLYAGDDFSHTDIRSALAGSGT